MLKEIQFQRDNQVIYAMDENWERIGEWECHDDFVEGLNDDGEPRESLPNGTYEHVSAEITDGKYGPSYGNFYITTGDARGRDIHGGGAGCPDPYADYQGWVPTYGCLRMQNADGVELSNMIIEAGNDVTLTVVDN